MTTVLEEIHKLVERRTPNRQWQALEFIRRLAQTNQANVPLSEPTTPLPPGTPGSVLLKLRFMSSKEDVEAMERALEDCERID